MRTCYKHGTVLRETADALGRGAITKTCEACDLYRQADALQESASRDTHPERAKRKMEIVEKMRSKALILCGRWYEVKRGDGEIWDMSERQIEAARKRGITIEVLTQIV